MDAIELQYKRIRQKYPDIPELEIWHGVAMDFYLRTGDIPTDVLIRSALARAETYGVKYRPDQLRVPAGNPDGGQWTDEGGGGANLRDRVARNRPREDTKPASSTPSAESTPAAATSTPQTYRDDFVPGDQQPIDGAEIIPAAGEGGNYGVNLLDDEGKNGAHTIAKHIHYDDASLLSTARSTQQKYLKQYRLGERRNGEIVVGAFTSLEAANKLVNATISDNKGMFAMFLASKDYVLLRSTFSEPTGREAYASNLWSGFKVRDTWSVNVLLMKDPSALKGYRVHTAFPSR